MNPSEPEAIQQPAFTDTRTPDTEWRTVLRLSTTLFAVSTGLSLLGSKLLAVPLLELSDLQPHAITAGLIASAPLLIGLFLLRRSQSHWERQLWEVPVELLGPALCSSSQIGRAGVALMAGVGEELLFRGLLQNWLEPVSLTAALILPNIAFGLLHCMNTAYAVAAGITGLYFSILVQFVPEVSLFSLMVAHAFYDFIALNCLTDAARRR
ncbi:CPBP family intramembrane metalloprotease [bacterium]|nr:CPBP family intramembrane metalloprotease [bacterium]